MDIEKIIDNTINLIHDDKTRSNINSTQKFILGFYIGKLHTYFKRSNKKFDLEKIIEFINTNNLYEIYCIIIDIRNHYHDKKAKWSF